jgi:hypothetical protein
MDASTRLRQPQAHRLSFLYGGHNMTNYHAILLGLFCWTIPILSQAKHSVEPNPDQTPTNAEMEIIAAVSARAQALAAGDCRKWATYVDPSFRSIDGDGIEDREAIVRGCDRSRRIPDHSEQRIVSDFHFQWIGRTPTVDYLYQTLDRFGEVTLSETARQVCTLEKRKNGWVAMVSIYIPLAQDPQPGKLDPKTLNDLTGVYAWIKAPHIADSIVRNGDRLFIQGTADPTPTELIPITDDTFFIHGSFGDRLTFVRDASGKVVEEEVRSPDGQGYRATKSKVQLSENEFNPFEEN